WVNANILVAINKVDRVSMDRVEEVFDAVASVLPSAKIVTISALRKERLNELVDAVVEYLSKISK
ncbi:MAG: hypothetical protein QW104_07625, partial [Nitrososphaerota archaeon]